MPRSPGALSCLGLLLRLRLRSALNAVRFARPAQRGLGVGLGVGGAALFALLFSLFRVLLAAAESAGQTMLHLLVDRTALFLFLFLLAGAVPFVSSTLFAPGDFSLLLATPVRPIALLIARLLDGAVVSSAQFVVIGVPLLLACAWVLGLSWWGWILFVVLVLLFLLLPPLLAAALLLWLAGLLGLRRVRAAVAVVSALLAVGMCLLLVSEFARQAGSASRSGLFVGAPGIAWDLSPAPSWLPSSWMSGALIALGSRRPVAALPPVLLLAASVVLCGAAAAGAGRRVLLGETLLEGEGGSGGDPARERGGLDRLLGLLPLSPPTRALVAKDLRYVTRDQVLLSQIGIPIILYLVPFVIAGQVREQGAGEADLLALTAGIMATIVYMETSILSLTSIGLEGRAFWLALGAPVSAGAFVRAKFAVAWGVSVGLCAPLWVLACAVLRASAVWWVAGLALLLVACAALCGLQVGIAGLFPRFVYDNPAHRASLSALVWGFVGAAGYAVMSLLVLAAGVVAAQHWPERAALILGGTLCLFFLFSSLTAIVPLLVARSRLEGYAWEH